MVKYYRAMVDIVPFWIFVPSFLSELAQYPHCPHKILYCLTICQEVWCDGFHSFHHVLFFLLTQCCQFSGHSKQAGYLVITTLRHYRCYHAVAHDYILTDSVICRLILNQSIWNHAVECFEIFDFCELIYPSYWGSKQVLNNF